ncbi:MAG TPA: hypothetical protein VGJ19_04225 [Streptosporangiaceae bacterium]
MSEEGRPLPQRERGATEAGARPAATAAGPPALTDDLRQRMKAAVDAERAQARERVTEVLRHPPQRRAAGAPAQSSAPDLPEQDEAGREVTAKRKRAARSEGVPQPGRRARFERHGKAEPPPNSSPAVAPGSNVIVAGPGIETSVDPVPAEPVSAHGAEAAFSSLPAPAAVPPPGLGPGHPSGPNNAQSVLAPSEAGPASASPADGPRHDVQSLSGPHVRASGPQASTAPPLGDVPPPAGLPRPAEPGRSGQLQPAGPGYRPGYRKARRRRTKIGLATGVVAMIAAVAVAAVMIASKGGTPRGGRSPAAPAQAAAVSWVVAQVSQKTVVSCDKATCSALVTSGYPPNNLRELGPNGALTNSSVVVVTPVARHLFGSSLVTAWAPSALASFGSGASTVSVRVVAPKGAKAYRKSERRDQAQRKLNEPGLTKVPNITMSGSAADDLRSGLVDGRLFEALANAAAAQSIDIVGFGNAGSGASPDVPLRYADLAAANPDASMSAVAYVSSLRAAMNDDKSARPDRMQIVTLPGGQRVLRVEFLAPSPFGVLANS